MLKRRPIDVPEGEDAGWAFHNGANAREWAEFKRTNVITVSMRVKWWWRRFERTLR